jgi:preprotein translocase subunit SecD
VRRRQAARIRLIATVAVVLAAAVYFLGVNPLPRHIRKGLDLQGGIEILYLASGTPHQPYSTAALMQTVQVINLRVNKLGVADPVIQAEPASHRILVELAGVKNPEQAQQVIGTTAVLQFKDSTGHIIVTGAELKNATAEISQTQGNVVALTFDAAGRRALAAFTEANVGKLMPIYLNGKLLMNPVINQPIPNGQAVITGNFTYPQAQALAIELNSGALPLKLSILSKTLVSATLGADSIQASLAAAIVAMALVVAFMLLVYRIPGFWADLALLVYALLLLGVLIGLGATLTLSGITGLILSIGMAVDSNVIIFERIKEELRAGRSLRSSVDEGFRNGLRAIVDSNATTIIACVVLYYLGSGLIRGFAVTLGVGVLISLLTAVVFTRYLLRWLVEAGAQPSFWFFAKRAEAVLGLGTVGAAPAVAGGGGLRPGRPAGRPSLFSRPGEVPGAAVALDSEASMAVEAATGSEGSGTDGPVGDAETPAAGSGPGAAAGPNPEPADRRAPPWPPAPAAGAMRPRRQAGRRGGHGRVRKGGR